MRYRKLPVEIEAVEWTGDNLSEILKFTDNNEGGFISFENDSVLISTLEGNICASKGDYIIKGISGEFYPFKPDIFKKIYEEV